MNLIAAGFPCHLPLYCRLEKSLRFAEQQPKNEPVAKVPPPKTGFPWMRLKACSGGISNHESPSRYEENDGSPPADALLRIST